MNSIIGIIFPLPENAINFMFSNKRDVYVKYLTHQLSGKSKIKLKNGLKLYFYQSGGIKSIVGDAIIKKIDFMDSSSIVYKYKGRLMIPDTEFISYINGRENKKALVLEFNNLEKYNKPIKLAKPLTMAGIYLTDENKDELLVED